MGAANQDTGSSNPASAVNLAVGLKGKVLSLSVNPLPSAPTLQDCFKGDNKIIYAKHFEHLRRYMNAKDEDADDIDPWPNTIGQKPHRAKLA